jgi:hypothetical protein
MRSEIAVREEAQSLAHRALLCAISPEHVRDPDLCLSENELAHAIVQLVVMERSAAMQSEASWALSNLNALKGTTYAAGAVTQNQRHRIEELQASTHSIDSP